MIQLKFRQFQTDSEDDSAMIQKGIFHEGSNFHFKSWSSQMNYLTFFDVLLWNKYFLL